MIELPPFHLPTMVLCAVRVGEHDHSPFTAADIAFMLDMPKGYIDDTLAGLVQAGAIILEGNRYRYDTSRSQTLEERNRLEELIEQLKDALSMLDHVKTMDH